MVSTFQLTRAARLNWRTEEHEDGIRQHRITASLEPRGPFDELLIQRRFPISRTCVRKCYGLDGVAPMAAPAH